MKNNIHTHTTFPTSIDPDDTTTKSGRKVKAPLKFSPQTSIGTISISTADSSPPSSSHSRRLRTRSETRSQSSSLSQSQSLPFKSPICPPSLPQSQSLSSQSQTSQYISSKHLHPPGSQQPLSKEELEQIYREQEKEIWNAILSGNSASVSTQDTRSTDGIPVGSDKDFIDNAPTPSSTVLTSHSSQETFKTLPEEPSSSEPFSNTTSQQETPPASKNPISPSNQAPHQAPPQSSIPSEVSSLNHLVCLFFFVVICVDSNHGSDL